MPRLAERDRLHRPATQRKTGDVGWFWLLLFLLYAGVDDFASSIFPLISCVVRLRLRLRHSPTLVHLDFKVLAGDPLHGEQSAKDLGHVDVHVVCDVGPYVRGTLNFLVTP